MSREYECVDCKTLHQTDAVKGPLPKRCPEHLRLYHNKYCRDRMQRLKPGVHGG